MNKRIIIITFFLLIVGNTIQAQWIETNSPHNDIFTYDEDILCLASIGNNILAGTYGSGVLLSNDSGST